MIEVRHNYGYIPDLPDNRDWTFKPAIRRAKLPKSVDLRTSGFEPAIDDQGQLGSCVANATAAAYEFEQRRQGLEPFDPSRLFIYYEARRMLGTLNYDSGSVIRDAMKVVADIGAPDEKTWPYDINRFTVQPSAEAYANARLHNALGYYRVPNWEQYPTRAALAQGLPVVFGFAVYPWFEDVGPSGICRPVAGQRLLGGHATRFVGYEKLPFSRKIYGIGANSWGSSWGDRGYFYMPLSWACDLRNADDFWVINQVEA